MRKSFYGLLAVLTIGLLIMTSWTGFIFSEIPRSHQSVTDNFQYIEDDPLEGQVMLGSNTQMYEGIRNQVYYNISLEIQSSTAMNLIIERIEFYLSPLNLESRELVGHSHIQLQIENTTSVNVMGSAEIRPVIITGETYLGCGVEYILSNVSLSGPFEYGNDSWFGPDGSLLMIPVTVYPTFLHPQGWLYGYTGTMILWGIIGFNELRKRIPP